MIKKQISPKDKEYKTTILPYCKVIDRKTGLERFVLTWVQIRRIINEELEQAKQQTANSIKTWLINNGIFDWKFEKKFDKRFKIK